MADKVTSTQSASADPNKKINDALDKAKDAMVEAGMPPDQADAMLNAARPNGVGTVVGNYADLQRAGAIANSGVMPTPPAEDDVETSNIEDAFTLDQGKGDVQDPDTDRLAFAHRLPEVTEAQKAADERHAEDYSTAPAPSKASTTSTTTSAKADDK